MNLLLFFGVIVIIFQVGQSSLLTKETAVGVNNDNGDPDQVGMNKGPKIITAELTRAASKLQADLFVRCACGKGETYTDAYIKGEIHYYGDHKDSNKIIRRERFGKTPRIDNNLSPVFRNFAKVNETDETKVGAYVELWDHDPFSEDDYLGSFTFPRQGTIAKKVYINTKEKSRDNDKAEAVKCPDESEIEARNCRDAIAVATLSVD